MQELAQIQTSHFKSTRQNIWISHKTYANLHAYSLTEILKQWSSKDIKRTNLVNHSTNRRRIVTEDRLVASPKSQSPHCPSMHNPRSGQPSHQLNGQSPRPSRRSTCHWASNRNKQKQANKQVIGNENRRQTLNNLKSQILCYQSQTFATLALPLETLNPESISSAKIYILKNIN